MACEHVRLPDGGVAICCGVTHKKKTAPCKFCDNRSTKLCDWKCERPEKVHHSKLKADDVIVTQQARHRLTIHGLQRIEGTFRLWRDSGKEYLYSTLDLKPHLRIVQRPVTIYGLEFPDGKCWLYYQIGNTKVQVLRPGTCDAPCCDLHSRHVADDVDYCMEHWKSWEERR